MRTTVDIPDELMRDVQEYLGFKSKREAVVHALEEVRRKKRVDEFMKLAGKIEFQPWFIEEHERKLRRRRKAS